MIKINSKTPCYKYKYLEHESLDYLIIESSCTLVMFVQTLP